MLYIYHLKCKKNCEIDYTIETDIKDLAKKTKPVCPTCGKRIYQDDEKTEILERKVISKKKNKTSLEDEIHKRQKHKKANDGRRKKK